MSVDLISIRADKTTAMVLEEKKRREKVDLRPARYGKYRR